MQVLFQISGDKLYTSLWGRKAFVFSSPAECAGLIWQIWDDYFYPAGSEHQIRTGAFPWAPEEWRGLQDCCIALGPLGAGSISIPAAGKEIRVEDPAELEAILDLFFGNHSSVD